MRTTDKPFNITKKQVYEAYKAVKSNQGAAGVDKETIEQFESNLQGNLYKLWNRMSSGSYFPPPVRAVSIPKKSGGERILGVPTVADRVAQMVVKQLIEPDLDPIFLADSYGYRPGKSALDAIGVTRERCWRYNWVLEFDIKGLFDNIDHELLLRAVRKHVKCKWALLYIERWLTAPMELVDGTRVERTRGTPQGGVISPILANLFMHYTFDLWMARTFPELPWCRYADDGLVHCRVEHEAERVKAALQARLTECHLEIHPTKTRIVYCKDGKRKGEYPNTKFDPTLTPSEKKSFPAGRLRGRARVLAPHLWDQGYFRAGAVADATSRMLGGSATPTALKTRPTSPVTGVRRRNCFPSCSVSISCSRSSSRMSLPHSGFRRAAARCFSKTLRSVRARNEQNTWPRMASSVW